MTAADPRGWCPSLFAPMPTGDGLLARIKPPGAVLTPEAARVLAAAAARWGNGVIEATTRAGLQVRGLAPAGVAPFAAAIVAAGLADADPGAERRRNVIATPLAGDDPAGHPHARQVTAALEAALAEPSLAGMPPKFGFLVDGGGILGVAAAPADIRILLDSAGAWLRLDGGVLVAASDDPAASALALALAFLDRAGPATRRMRDLTPHAEAALFAASRLDPVPARGIPAPPGPAVGWHACTPMAGAFGVGLPFGTMTAADLNALADLADRFGSDLRVTPWRALLLAGLPASALPAVRLAASQLNLIADSADPRLTIAACPGSPACASATVETRAVAVRLAAAGSGPAHVSGCSKGCAHPGPAALTLVGNAGRFDLVRNGRAGNAPVATGLTAAEAVACA